LEPISVEPAELLARLTERLPSMLTDPRVGQLLVECTMRDAAIEQLQKRVAELEGQIAATNGAKKDTPQMAEVLD
jgi:hypothetical protein